MDSLRLEYARKRRGRSKADMEVMEYLNELIIAAGELKLIGSKILGGKHNDDRGGNTRVP